MRTLVATAFSRTTNVSRFFPCPHPGVASTTAAETISALRTVLGPARRGAAPLLPHSLLGPVKGEHRNRGRAQSDRSIAGQVRTHRICRKVKISIDGSSAETDASR